MGRLVPSCWVASYPARWVAPLPIRWVQLYPFAGYKTDYEQARGLLEPADPEPVEAEVAVHVDVVATEEVQAVRLETARWAST